MDLNVFETANAGFAQAVYEEYLRNPSAVSAEWRRLFESGVVGEPPAPGQPTGNGASSPGAASPAPAPRSGAPANAAPLKGPAARLVANMTDSLRVPTATTFREVAVAALERHRAALNAALQAAGRAEKVSFTHLIGYAIVQAVKAHPMMVDTLAEYDGVPHRVRPDTVGLGIAVDMERKDGSRGLVVPVIKAADRMDFAAFHATYEALVEKARTNKLLPDDFTGGTIQLTNPGGLGTVASVPRLMANQGTIVAVGAIAFPPEFATVPAERIRELGISKVMTVTSTYDHRIIQGAESGSFLRTIERLLSGADPFYEAVFQSLGLPAAGAGATVPAPAAASRPAPSAASEDFRYVAAAMGLVKAFRTHGHLAARLDPLGSEPIGDPALDPAGLGLTPAVMGRIPAGVLRVAVPGESLAEALPHLRDTYCGTMAYEVEHISDHAERVWLRNAIESGAYRAPLSAEERLALLDRLTAVETFERFLHKAYLGQKRFSIEGVDALVPMLDLAADLAAGQGARDVTIGMAHRGRLNVLVHTVGRPYESILAEFEGHQAHPEEPDAGTGDVKYHLGAEGTLRGSSGATLTVSVLPNPSHLEFIAPVVNGRTRARQTSRKGRVAAHDPTAAVSVVIHGDAAFAGQGVVAETLNLANLTGYGAGGTLHIITNNQVGFTTDMRDSRSTRYASDLAKGFDVAIIHVNADDPEACLSAVRLAMAYRARFRSDVLIDLVGYRRWGHNEGDEPAYTQPTMYARIKDLPTVRAQYAERLVREGLLTAEEADAGAARAYQRLVEVQQALKAAAAATPRPESPPAAAPESPGGDTALPADFLAALNEQLLARPEGFTVHPKLARQLDRRRQDLTADGGIDWGHAEALAVGALLLEGVPVRLTGQDSERGTFSHRHFVLHDVQTGATWTPLQHLVGAQAPLEVHNSPLSELATMGFEYGYSVAAPEALVLWEGQFGDFVNGAQVFLDQFVAAGQSKWGQRTRLTLLLPHGYEGQGPEHSSARLERFLQLCAERNMRVVNCTTPAQYFHLLRRQARHGRVRPLVVMSPKSLLRLPAAGSSLADLTGGAFAPVLDDPTKPVGATHAVLTSGKLYYELAAAAKGAAHPPALLRQELLYPFPTEELREVLARYPKLRVVTWAQEEPRNMGAWGFVSERLRALLPEGVSLRYAGRPERASPAEGYPAAHAKAQARLVEEALRGS